MNVFVRLVVPAFATTSLAIALVGTRAAVGQERQGCFVVDPFQGLVELDDICPTPEPFILPSTGANSLGTGDVQVTLRWATIDDLDLAVTGPDGVTVFWENPGVSGLGGQLDQDDNSECLTLTNSPVENIFWPVGAAPNGEYFVEVALFQRCGSGSDPIDFELQILTLGMTDVVQGTVDDANPSFSYTFLLPTSAPVSEAPDQ
ncbi:MAG: hypothetical protein F6K30_17405 [Cyanothece sp. SIO2G6]|nr:hypothetical protein [Cyanothece sp. SIO2G6]